MGFTIPLHPGQLHSKLSEKKNVACVDKDPHIAPSISNLDSETILYLPPLLSSLPPTQSNEFLPRSDHTPYTETHLPDIDPVSLSLHKALHHFCALDDKYASRPYQEAFNWDEVAQWMEEDEEREWYIVAFRSQRRDGSDGTRKILFSGYFFHWSTDGALIHLLALYNADKLAHEEAVKNGGLIMYWYGVPDPETGLNLATCIWQSRAHAIAANPRPKHAQAAKLAKSSFSTYALERYILRKVKGRRELDILEYVSGEVGWWLKIYAKFVYLHIYYLSQIF
jgi:hypothetical protein